MQKDELVTKLKDVASNARKTMNNENYPTLIHDITDTQHIMIRIVAGALIYSLGTITLVFGLFMTNKIRIKSSDKKFDGR